MPVALNGGSLSRLSFEFEPHNQSERASGDYIIESDFAVRAFRLNADSLISVLLKPREKLSLFNDLAFHDSLAISSFNASSTSNRRLVAAADA